MAIFGWRDWLFSAKAFAGSMLALYVALAAGLPRPYWAMATAYIVASPLSGATRSKALYRVLGTMLGAAASVVLVPTLVDAPVLLSLAIAAWTGLCLAISLLDRSPRSYVFMLAGYSAPIIGLPAVADPGAIFETAVARTEEITLGILCASLVSTLVLPSSVGPVLDARIGAWFTDAARWSLDVLDPARRAGGAERPASREERRRLAADVHALDLLISHLGYDPAMDRRATEAARELRGRMVVLLPVLSSIEDRVATLAGIGGVPPDMARLMREVADWIDTGQGVRDTSTAGTRRDADRLREQIGRLEPLGSDLATWRGLMLSSLLLRIAELVGVWEDCRILRARIAGEQPAGEVGATGLRATGEHLSGGLAVFSGISVAVAMLLCCAAWIGTGWPEGAMAAQMVAVGCSFFAAQDDPAPAILRFMAWTAVAVLVAGAYTFAIFPLVHDFVTLVLVLAPVFLVYGALVARPATYGAGMPLAVNTASILAVQETFQPDFAGFVNSALAMLAGMGAAAVFTALVRTAGADWTSRRLLRAAWRDLAALADGRSRQARGRFSGLMLDRLAQLAPKLAASQEAADEGAVAVLRDLRTGLNIFDLQRDARALGAPSRTAVRHVLKRSASHFRRQARDGIALRPAERLLRSIDRAIASLLEGPVQEAGRDALQALVGLRQALFPGAGSFEPPSQVADPPARRRAGAIG